MKIANGRAYGDSDWHDLLTELNDTPIAYEGQTYNPETNEVRGSILSGNPKYYNGWNFDWQRGRELAKAEQADDTTNTTLTYAYDADGIRTSKTYTVETYETQYTVTFVADGTTVKTMTVADGYTLKDSDYPTVPAKSGYTGTWQRYTSAIHSNVTVQAVYTQIKHTVTFVADGTTVKTMTVNDGYILKSSDYPTVPAKSGYIGAWEEYTDAIYSDLTVQAVYTSRYHTVTFKADGTTLKTMTVEDGYVLQDSDYPEIPPKDGTTSFWRKYTDAIHSDITLNAKYSTVLPHIVTFVANRKTLKTMEVVDGYVLKDSDYPSLRGLPGVGWKWQKYTAAIHEDITVTATMGGSGGGGGGITIPSVRPSYSDAISDLPEPIEPQDVAKPDDTSENTAEPLSNRPGQTLVSTQTVTHEYLTLSGKVAQETVKVNGSVTEILDFIYDESGRPFALIYRTDGVGVTLSTYYYVLNLQGDVVKLVNPVGTVVASYEYDAWGNVLSKSGTMADKNPLRYRSYYYDNETGYYYLQSRYYDPTMRRFLNADGLASTGQGFVGVNMFAYCNNNPVTYADSTGTAADPRFNVSYINEGCGISPLKYALEDYVRNSGKYSPDVSYDATNIRISVRDTGRKRMQGKDMFNFSIASAVAPGAGALASSALIKLGYVAIGGMVASFSAYIAPDLLVAGIAHACYEEIRPVPDGDYDSFVVTISWDSNVRDFGVSPERTLIGYTATYTFIWCDAFDDDQYWWVDAYDLQPVYEPLLP